MRGARSSLQWPRRWIPHYVNGMDEIQHDLGGRGWSRWIEVPHRNCQREIKQIESSLVTLSHNVGWWKKDGNSLDQE